MEDFADIEKKDRLLINIIKPIAPTNEQFNEYLVKLLEEIRSAEDPLVMITDITYSKLITPEQRNRLSDFYRSERITLKNKLIGAAYIITSPVYKMVLNSVFMVGSTPPVDYIVVESMDQALKWAYRKL